MERQFGRAPVHTNEGTLDMELFLTVQPPPSRVNTGTVYGRFDGSPKCGGLVAVGSSVDTTIA
ncbi:hypothetical protein J6590_034199 [Homalodisca vitripennis]|nr:hypothetical protein J6590_034199 [Homalodisca vitripennis]